ncbi:hypothetical protein Leryth_007283 [Lithospermum erythrorhizon]|nr:hypothetical protein Leryth_007283 [Lithospermum erythrorhizon]
MGALDHLSNIFDCSSSNKKYKKRKQLQWLASLCQCLTKAAEIPNLTLMVRASHVLARLRSDGDHSTTGNNMHSPNMIC